MTSLQMLWESEDPARVLRDRFGMTSADAASAWVAEVLETDYGRELKRCERIVMSDGNALAWVSLDTGERWIVKWSVKPDRFSRLTAIAHVTDWLRTEGLPVSAPIPAIDDRLQVERDGVSLGVQSVLPGHLLKVTDELEVLAAGRVLAAIHVALARCPHTKLLQRDDAPVPVRELVVGWLDHAAPNLDQVVVDALRGLLPAVDLDASGHQLVHGDYRSANVLVQHRRVSGVLDFEEIRWDQPVVELARQAVLLGTQYQNWGPVPTLTMEKLRAGYEAIRPLTAAERGWWRPLVLWFTLLLTPPGDDPTGWGESARQQLLAL